MKQIGVGIIGTGWCGGIRAETCAAHPLVGSLHIARMVMKVYMAADVSAEKNESVTLPLSGSRGSAGARAAEHP